MENVRFHWLLIWSRRIGAIALTLGGMPFSQAATVWTGPNLSFTQSSSVKSDVVMEGKVVLSRGIMDVLYNTAAGESSAGAVSPAGTEWAFGSLDDFASLSYTSLESMRNGNLRALILNKPMVMHIMDDDIYLSVTFTAWGTHHAGGFAYTRSTPAIAAAPAITILTPASGDTFTTAAAIHLTADATISGGVVTNVAYFAGTNLLGSATAAPFQVTGSISTPGPYALTAVATASGISSTSGIVNVTIVAPTPISLTGAHFGQNSFSFSYNADLGTSYVVDTSTNLVNWSALSTNVAASNPASFSDSAAANSLRFYRVSRLLNP